MRRPRDPAHQAKINRRLREIWADPAKRDHARAQRVGRPSLGVHRANHLRFGYWYEQCPWCAEEKPAGAPWQRTRLDRQLVDYRRIIATLNARVEAQADSPAQAETDPDLGRGDGR